MTAPGSSGLRLTAIIMGAAVRADGSPSGALRRRVDGALSLRDEFPEVIYIPTGGVGDGLRHSEAEVMQRMLISAGVAEERILPEGESRTTIESLVRCSRIINANRPGDSVVVCSDRYHIPRCRLQLRLLGISTIFREMPSGRKANGLPRWAWYYVREALAVPYTLLAVAWLRAVGRV